METFLKFIRSAPLAFLIFVFRKEPVNLFLTYLTSDTVYTSLDYVVRGREFSDEHPIVHRYIYFGIATIAYMATRFILWSGQYGGIVMGVYFLLSTPIVMDMLMEKIPVVKVKKKLLKILKKVLCEQITRVTNHVANKLLHLRVVIAHQDVTIVIENADRKSALVFAQSLAIAVITHVVESNYTLARYAFKLYSGSILNDIGIGQPMREDDQKNLLRSIIYTRNWVKLSDPSTIRLLIKLYDPNDKSAGVFFKVLMDAVMKFLCCTSLGSFVGSLGCPISGGGSQALVTVLSFAFHYRNRNRALPIVLSYVRCFGFIAGYATSNYALNSFLCEFGDMLRLDRIGSSLARITRQELIPSSFNKIFIFFPLGLFALTLIFGQVLVATILALIALPSPKVWITRPSFSVIQKFPSGRLVLVYLIGWFSAFSLVHLLVVSIGIGLLEKEENEGTMLLEEPVLIDEYVK